MSDPVSPIPEERNRVILYLAVAAIEYKRRPSMHGRCDGPDGHIGPQ